MSVRQRPMPKDPKRCDNCYGRRAKWRGTDRVSGMIWVVCPKCKYILSKTEPKTRYK